MEDSAPGIRRQRSGSGFRYLDADGKPVRDAATLQRIRALAIPPAYRDVWICASPQGHLQACGRDARGRKQYRYHPRWRLLRDAGKFDRLVAFGRALPRLRRRVRSDIAQSGWTRDKVLATVVAILAATLIRVGNDAYARENGSYGLTTLRNRHARFLRGGLALEFKGKGGRRHQAELADPKLARLVRRMHELPGQQLFQYRDGRRVRPVTSTDVNDYLRDCMGDAFTAKDFRTWGATLAAFRQLAATPPPPDADERELAAVCNAVVESVAAMLGNTPAICRKSYIDPCVFEGWRDGSLQRSANGARGDRQWEQAALRFLARAHRARPAASATHP